MDFNAFGILCPGKVKRISRNKFIRKNIQYKYKKL